jgi:hypothetical protein
MKACPHCRLPIRLPGATFHATSDDGAEFVGILCMTCTTRLNKLPTSTRIKALNRAADNVLHDPDRFAHRAFSDHDQASLFCALAACPDTVAGVLEELLQTAG